jgi:hypothetical protein
MITLKKKTQKFDTLGLNVATLMSLEYNATGWGHECVDISFDVEGREYRVRLIPPAAQRIDWENNLTYPEIKDPTPAQTKKYEGMMSRLGNYLTDLALSYVSQEELEKFNETVEKYDTLQKYVKAYKRLISKNIDNPIHIWLQYEKKGKEGTTYKYLRVPSWNETYGQVFSKVVIPVDAEGNTEDSWTEVKSQDKGIRYVDGAGNSHPIYANPKFLQSPHADNLVATSVAFKDPSDDNNDADDDILDDDMPF